MDTIQELAVSLIDENPDNEKIFSMNDIDHLAEMIDNQGFRGAIEVMKKEDGRYEIVSGHRRYRAYVSLGHKTIPCIVSPSMSDIEKTKTLISSNINSRKMEPLDYARAIQYYIEKVCIPLKLNKEKECMHFFGISRPQYYRYLRMLGLNERLLAYANSPKFPYTALVDKTLSDDVQNQIANILDKKTKENNTLNPALFTKQEVEAIVARGYKKAGFHKENDIEIVTKKERYTIEYLDKTEKNTEELLKKIVHIKEELEAIYNDIIINDDEKLKMAFEEVKEIVMQRL